MPRGMWKGSISFGLVTIGVELYNAEAPERLDLDLLDKRDMARIGYLKINKRTGKPVDAADIVHGFDVGDDRYVVLSAEDLKSANPRAVQTIDVLGFLPADAVPRIFYAKPYIATPTKGSEKAYALFHHTLETMDRVALAQVVIRTRQYLTVVYPFEGALVAQLLRYEEEIRTPKDLGLGLPRGASRAVRAPEQAMARRLVTEMALDWEPGAYRDSYRDDVLKLIKQRVKGAKPVHEAPSEAKDTKVIDLMEALRKSVADRGNRGRTHAPRRTASRKRSA